MRKLSITIVAIFYIVNTICGQSNKKLLAEIKQLQNTYKKDRALQFDIRYVYSKESRPSALLDSLEGKMEVSGNNYRIELNNTVTIKNDQYVINIFKDDKLIYVTRPSWSERSTSPSMLIDSAFANISNLTYTIDSNTSIKRLALNFPKESSYKKVLFTINNASGYVTKVRYIVKTDRLLMTTGPGDAAKGNDEYGIVEATFSNYKKGQNMPEVFDEKVFFIKKGNEYIPTDKYKDFSIFLGSPNL
jgi:hypothetical protein